VFSNLRFRIACCPRLVSPIVAQRSCADSLHQSVHHSPLKRLATFVAIVAFAAARTLPVEVAVEARGVCACLRGRRRAGGNGGAKFQKTELQASKKYLDQRKLVPHTASFFENVEGDLELLAKAR
jgi:hypothetical protein